MSRPNILVVMADQLAPHFTGAYGHPLVRTPAMEALAERGTRFDAAYCHSPLCAPARFTMLSGQPVSAIGAWDNAAEFPASVPTLAHYLTLAGYRTCLSGKMHFVGPDQLHGFEERLTTDIYPADFAWTPDWDEADTRIGKWYHNMDSLAEAGQALATYQIDYDEEVGFASVRRLYDLARDSDERPFFLVASFIHPHDPYVARPEWWDLYEHDDIDLPEPMPAGAMDPHTRRIRRGIEADTVGYTEGQCRNARHGYYANTSYFDSWVGRLVGVLHETGRLDNTVVIVTATTATCSATGAPSSRCRSSSARPGCPSSWPDPGWPAGRSPTSARTSTCCPRCSTSQPAAEPGPESGRRSPGAASGSSRRAEPTPPTRPPASTRPR